MFQKKIIAFLLSLISLNLFAESYNTKPDPELFIENIADKPLEGIDIVNKYCANCHAYDPPIKVGAPAIADEAAWRFRLEKGFNTMLENTIEGYGAMPARGGCFDCTDDELILAILELLPADLRNAYISIRSEHIKNKKSK